MVNQISIIA